MIWMEIGYWVADYWLIYSWTWFSNVNIGWETGKHRQIHFRGYTFFFAPKARKKWWFGGIPDLGGVYSSFRRKRGYTRVGVYSIQNLCREPWGGVVNDDLISTGEPLCPPVACVWYSTVASDTKITFVSFGHHRPAIRRFPWHPRGGKIGGMQLPSIRIVNIP